MTFRADIVTLFPPFFKGWLDHGGVARAINRSVLEVGLVDLRPFGLGPHLQVDDYSFGGGPGMLLRPEPIFAAVESIKGVEDGPVLLLTPRGGRFNQTMAQELTGCSRITLICGHYEGVDERVAEHLSTEQISVGDFVLSGGEPAAMVVIDAVARLLPGAIDEASRTEESFVTGLLEYPQYTRPATFRGWSVPEILLSGDHGKIAEWRQRMAERKTRSSRPDLLGGTTGVSR